MHSFCMGFLVAGIAVAQPVAARGDAPPQPAPGVVDPSLIPYASTAESVRLPDGRMIHVVCMGYGSPTVILTAGNGSWGIDWHKVQPEVAKTTQVCAWDRAGLGLSGPSALVQTVDNTTTDLETALAAGEITGPYIMVGHSLGAYESVMFADRQPANVAGIVLVDPSIPDQTAYFARATPAFASYYATLEQPLVPILENCAAQVRAGTARPGGPDPDRCFAPRQWPASYPPELTAALNGLLDNPDMDIVASAMETFASSIGTFDQSAVIAINPQRDLGDIPLIVLSRDALIPIEGLPEGAAKEVPLELAAWHRAHAEYAALSRRGVHRVVPDSTHGMPVDKPEPVIEAIREVIEIAREQAH